MIFKIVNGDYFQTSAPYRSAIFKVVGIEQEEKEPQAQLQNVDTGKFKYVLLSKLIPAFGYNRIFQSELAEIRDYENDCFMCGQHVHAGDCVRNDK